jgi:putative transposase
MPRREIPFLPDVYYHFYNRGNNRQAVFFEAANYLYFLRGIKKYVLPVAEVIAYCLMPTHYHILVRVLAQTSEVSMQVSRAMQKFLISYTKAINKRFERVGALFQGQFQAKPVQRYDHLLNLCVYIHANPVKDGLVSAPEDWPYSNYLEWMGERDGTLFDPEFVRDNFGAPQDYQALVAEYLRTRILPEDINTYLQSLEG